MGSVSGPEEITALELKAARSRENYDTTAPRNSGAGVLGRALLSVRVCPDTSATEKIDTIS
jgi:hypothetical protein